MFFKLYFIAFLFCFIGMIIFDIRMSESIKLKGYKRTRKGNLFLDLLSLIFLILFISIIPFFNLYFLIQFILYDDDVMIIKLLDKGVIYHEGDL